MSTDWEEKLPTRALELDFKDEFADSDTLTHTHTHSDLGDIKLKLISKMELPIVTHSHTHRETAYKGT